MLGRQTLAASLAAAAALTTAVHAAETPLRVSGPHSHANLSIYFLHGQSAGGPVPLTLAEALTAHTARVNETGHVSSLKVENTGDAPVFIQAGDIVKGGQQDRVLTVSLLLPAKSGLVDIGSLCVEQGRWSARGAENVKLFTSSAESLPSRTAKLAMAAPATEPRAGGRVTTTLPPANQAPIAGQPVEQRQQRIEIAPSQGPDKQRKVWDEVASIQSKLGAKLRGDVKAAESATSLQLSLENQKLKAARAGFLDALAKAPEAMTDVVGYVVAIDGKLELADVYPSHGLFKKMWAKGLNAAVTEAIGTGADAATPANLPTSGDVERFLASADGGKTHETTVGALMTQATRETEQALAVIATTRAGEFVYRNVLRK
jgi:hypothetical protein